MKTLDYKEIYSKLQKRTELYAQKTRNVFLNRLGEIARMCDGITLEEDEVFKFNDHPEIARQVQEKLRTMYSELYQQVRGDIVQEWRYANGMSDMLVRMAFGKESEENPHFAKYFQRNREAMNAFFERKQQGMSLSQRVWKLVGEAKEELELALDLGLGEGKDADALSRDVRKYLQNPDALFRRVRDKHGNLVLSKAARAYHPGRGVYRSAYKNAMRLTRTETNMAYRTADVTRWQQMKFITGYEVKISKQHPYPDICDTLAGKYPVTFKFVGWHPHCFCYIVPIMCTDKELEELQQRILDGTDGQFTPSGVVQDVPPAFTKWIQDNEERIKNAHSLPYFIRDNYPDGDISKAGKWVTASIPNKAGMDNFVQLAAKKEVDVSLFDKVTSYTDEDFKASSNFISDESDELVLMRTKHKEFNKQNEINEPANWSQALSEAAKGNLGAFESHVNADMLKEMQKVAHDAKFASEEDGKYCISVKRELLTKALQGNELEYKGSVVLGTDYCRYAKRCAMQAGGEEEHVMLILNVPKGSRYVKSMQMVDGTEMQKATFLPNTKMKLVSKVDKTVIVNGKASVISQYEFELVEDGCAFVKELEAKQLKVAEEVNKHQKAVKVANNVLNAAEKHQYKLKGVDAAAHIKDMEDKLIKGLYSHDEITKQAQALAKAVAVANKEFKVAVKTAEKAIAEAEELVGWGIDTSELKTHIKLGIKSHIDYYTTELKKATKKALEDIKNIYGTYIDDPVDVLKQHGMDALTKLHKSIDDKMNLWASHSKSGDLYWWKNKLEYEINYVESKKAYVTWKEAVSAYKQKLKEVELKIQIGDLDKDIQEAIKFAATTKSKKFKQMVAEMQDMLHDAHSIDEAALKAKMDTIGKEMARLEKGRTKVTGKIAMEELNDMEKFYTAEEKKEINRLVARLEKETKDAQGDIRDSAVKVAQNDLSGKIEELALKYVSKQPKIKHIGGLTDSQVREAIDDYLATTPTNPYVWVWEDLSLLTFAQAKELARIQISITKASKDLRANPTNAGYKSKLNNARAELDSLCKSILASPQRNALNADRHGNYYRMAFSDEIGGAFRDMVNECKQLSKKIATNGVTIPWEELSLITRFTANSNFVNQYCFGVGPVQRCLDPVIRQELREIIETYKKAVNGVIERMPRYKGHLYRGADISPEAIADPTKDGFWNSIIKAWNSPNKIWETPAPMSATFDISPADSFANGVMGAPKGQRVIMKLISKTGVKISDISEFSWEEEVLFRGGSKFRIIKAPYQSKTEGIGMIGDWVVELEEVLD